MESLASLKCANLLVVSSTIMTDYSLLISLRGSCFEVIQAAYCFKGGFFEWLTSVVVFCLGIGT